MKDSLLVAIDIGNSSINIGYFTAAGLIVQRIDTFPLKTSLEYKRIFNDFITKNDIEKNCFSVIISSVVLGHTPVFRNLFEQLLAERVKGDVILVHHSMHTGLRFNMDAPEEVGTDRIANAAGAYERYKTHVAVVDFGTATTVTVINRDAEYLGGSIMPGLGMMNEMLERGTSRLKKVDLAPPVSALGRATAGNICSGLFWGTAGAVERVLDEIEKETRLRFKVVITGGYCTAMDEFIRRRHDMNPELTLEGLKILYEKNRYT